MQARGRQPSQASVGRLSTKGSMRQTSVPLKSSATWYLPLEPLLVLLASSPAGKFANMRSVDETAMPKDFVSA